MEGLGELAGTWDHLGRTDPLWAVLTSPDKRFGKWDEAEFFAAGVDEIRRVLPWVETNAQVSRGRALDFGCGVGRLSRALAGEFASVTGVDVAPSMVELAGRLNRGVSNVEFVVNSRSDLSLFEDSSFDLIYTTHVLQHMPPDLQRGYLTEFVRVLRPGGVAVVELVNQRHVGASEPLPDDAYRASVTVEEPAITAIAQQRLPLTVSVTNTGPVPLPAAGTDGWYQVTAANSWRRANGELVVRDDARADLPHDLAPGASVQVVLDVTAPAHPGEYLLELDCVQEGVAWFADRGSTPSRVPVTVRRRRRSRRPREAPGHDTEQAVMQMHGLPDSEVRASVTGAGGRVVADEDWSLVAGQQQAPDWERRIYVIGS
jgi:SAM-dependent methyltransferase